MSRPSNRLAEPASSPAQTVLTWAFILITLLGVVVVNVCLRLGNALAGTPVDLSSNPFEVPFDLFLGPVSWPGTWGWVVLAAQVLVLAVVTALVLTVRHRRRNGPRGSGRREPVDVAARYMGRGRDVAPLTTKTAAATAARLGVAPLHAPGLPIGVCVADGTPLVTGWEYMRLTLMGPRMGKTTALVIPEVLEAPGAVLVTSNKRDVVDELLPVRSEGGRSWVFDPQDLLGQRPAESWWWNPLETVHDEASAEDLAEHFASGSRAPGGRTDVYFDGQARSLLAALLLAAALEGLPISQVGRWLTQPADKTAVQVLSRRGVPLQADLVQGIATLHERTRGGIYSTAQQMTKCLTDRRLLGWITPPGTPEATLPGEPRLGTERFEAAEFVASSQPRTGTWGEHIHPSAPTLFSLSREGAGSAGPIVLALTAAVVKAAEKLAAASTMGRLLVPMVAVLDEAANVCRWSGLPDLYSHYGSRGIIIDTILQSYAQGEDVWGRTGMRKLWSAANVKIVGGGAADTSLLAELVDLIGERDRMMTSVSSGGGSGSTRQRSASQHLTREAILTKADLASLPQGRAVVLASGMRPTLVRTVAWFNGPHAERVRQSAG